MISGSDESLDQSDQASDGVPGHTKTPHPPLQPPQVGLACPCHSWWWCKAWWCGQCRRRWQTCCFCWERSSYTDAVGGLWWPSTRQMLRSLTSSPVIISTQHKYGKHGILACFSAKHLEDHRSLARSTFENWRSAPLCDIWSFIPFFALLDILTSCNSWQKKASEGRRKMSVVGGSEGSLSGQEGDDYTI